MQEESNMAHEKGGISYWKWPSVLQLPYMRYVYCYYIYYPLPHRFTLFVHLFISLSNLYPYLYLSRYQSISLIYITSIYHLFSPLIKILLLIYFSILCTEISIDQSICESISSFFSNRAAISSISR